jgi:hypothetical protein
MDFGAGLGGSAVGSLYQSPGGGYSAAGPAATAGPTGNTSLVQAAFGVGPDTSGRAGYIAALVGAASWFGLAYLWWVLPR